VKDMNKEQWFAALKEGPPTERAKVKKVVKEYGPQDRVIYIRMGFPISLISDREQVIRWTREEVNATDSSLLLRSVLVDECPITDNVVRAQMFKGQIIRQHADNAKDLHIVDYTNMDLKGHIPSRFINMMLSTMMPKVMAEIVAQARKEI